MGAIGMDALLIFPRDSPIHYLPIPEKMDMAWFGFVAFHIKRVCGGDYHAHSFQKNIIRPNIAKIAFDLGGISDKVKTRIEQDLWIFLNNWTPRDLGAMKEYDCYLPCSTTLLLDVDCEY
jgi:hypothetical protein